MLLKVLISFLLHCTFAFLIKFLFDTTNLWQEKKHYPSLSQPSVADLSQDASRYVIEKYEKEVLFGAVSGWSDGAFCFYRL